MKLVVERATGRVLGCHIVGHDGPEMIQLAAIAVKAGLTKAQWDATCALHPTAAEELVTLREASPTSRRNWRPPRWTLAMTSISDEDDLRTPLLTAVLLAMFALTFPLGYAWDLGFSGLAALAGMLCIPALRRARPPVRVLLPLLALVAWALFSLTWSRAAVDPHSACWANMPTSRN